MFDIAEYLIKNTPENTVFCPLMMDFNQGIDGIVNKDIFEHLDELKLIRDKYPANFLPFVAIDPNNPLHLKLFEKAFSKEYNFFGVKIYPAMGYLPSNPSLMKVFEICSQYEIPVTTHSGSSSVHTNHNKLKINFLDFDENQKLVLKNDKKNFYFKKQFDNYFNNPKNWEPVLTEFPNLRLNLAHFGGESEWNKKNRNNKKLC